ncbi:hypothetical protein NM208_g9938 [Fusarium decemcellulare]|uniref:Uncharacterized protein n=1 Tax=Fusarium decemcellulare TaxID=57161 RepID=A0ACC1RZW6_9HYPO|nr:hypothetical protein NM208_g9938 [Fusarium decemcellulare]
MDEVEQLDARPGGVLDRAQAWSLTPSSMGNVLDGDLTIFVLWIVLAPEVKNTIIRLLPNVRATDSNRTQPSGHKVWKEGRKSWNLGHWVIMNGIYGLDKLSSMKNGLEKKHPEVNMKDPYGKERTKQAPAHSQQAAGYRQPQPSHEGGGGIRRKTAKDLSSKIGAEMTWAIMATTQAPLLEKFYTGDRTSIPDLTPVALDAVMLNVMFRELREMDKEYPHDGDTKSEKNRDCALRKAPLWSVMDELIKGQKATLTIDEANLRAEGLQSMSNELNRRVLERATQYVIDNPSASGDAVTRAVEDESSLFLKGDFPEDDQANEVEDDAEDQFQDQILKEESVQTFPDKIPDDITGDIAQQLSTLDYATAARAAMEVWLAVGTSNPSNYNYYKQFAGIDRKQNLHYGK